MSWATESAAPLYPQDYEEGKPVHLHEPAYLSAEPKAGPTPPIAHPLVVDLGPPSAAVRGRLSLFVEGAIERELDRRAAPPPGVAAALSPDASLRDHLYRARCIGADGLALRFASLASITSGSGALNSKDSATLRWWLRATHERPVKLTFDPRDRYVGVYSEPVELRCLLEEHDEAHASDDASEEEAESAAPPSTDESLFSDTARALAETLAKDGDAGWLHDTLMHLSTPPPPAITLADSAAHGPTHEEALTEAQGPLAQDEALTEAQGPLAQEEALTEAQGPLALELTPPSLDAFCMPEPADSDAFEEDAPAEATDTAAAPEPADVETQTAAALEGDAQAESQPEPAEEIPEVGQAKEDALESPPPSSPDPELLERCATYQRELESSNGPKPLSVIERQFTSAYAPLRELADVGLAPAGALAALAQWGASFEHSYTEAFEALRHRGKRPTMVLDVPDIALRLARLHGARATQLLVVDSMRFDLGLKVQERLRALASGRAACVDRQLLWAGLPTTTATQIELIGRGAGGLREFTGEVEDDLLVARGRKAATIRRLRTGRRELLKVDIVEARLTELDTPPGERLDEIAHEVAERIAAHFEGVPERTLVLLFGDHGFVFDELKHGKFGTHHGGARPEEVLVPAFAWLVGAVH